MRLLITLLCLMTTFVGTTQNIKVYGTVTNALNNEPIPFANVVIDGTIIGVTTDLEVLNYWI